MGSPFLLFAAGILGGVMNALAGGGTFVVFPALLYTGVPPVPANATNTVALWPGLAASVRAFWPRLKVARRLLVSLLGISLLGGVAGAVLLIRTPADIFMKLVPWLMLAATGLFALGGRIGCGNAATDGGELTGGRMVLATLFELGVAVYGGYFGGGIGILILAMLGAMGMNDIHEMNALKIVLTTAINGIAVVTFIVAGAVRWPQALVILAGAVLGGYFAAHYSQKMPEAWIRGFVLVVGAGMTTYFFLRPH
ncbi:MAG TPA: sulfite exporter TauE/SafE family protein [Candidatus Solibacter sp.]|nr:sulfite exporter TauE/SafE family protein [Candidatus Solibacter sp.]